MTFVETLRKRNINPKDEILSGLTVALALVPEAVAFSLIAHVSPLIGLYTAFIFSSAAMACITADILFHFHGLSGALRHFFIIQLDLNAKIAAAYATVTATRR